MADDAQNDSPRSDRVDVKEDADTAAARKELRHTVISEERKAAGSDAGDTGRTTPDAPQDPDTIDQVASPKKKRAREDDAVVDIEDLDAQSIASTDSAKDRASRLEPEKKRHRDAAETEASAAAAKSDVCTALIWVLKEELLTLSCLRRLLNLPTLPPHRKKETMLPIRR